MAAISITETFLRGELLSSSSSFQQSFTSLSPALLFHSGLPSPQLTFPPLQPFILQMLAWLYGLSSQHKGCSVDNGLASAWAPASVICPRQPATEPRGGQAWAGHEALKEAGGWGLRAGATRQEWSHSCERRVSCPLLIPFSSFLKLCRTVSHPSDHMSISQGDWVTETQYTSSECSFSTFFYSASPRNTQDQ